MYTYPMTVEQHVLTFMATMEVPQKKKGDMSSRAASSCRTGVVSVASESPHDAYLINMMHVVHLRSHNC